MEKGNIYQKIPDELESEHFLKLAEGEGLDIERIVSKGHKSPEDGWYDQDRAEWVVLLKGTAHLEFEAGRIVELAPGDYINIPAHCRHRVAWTSSSEHCVWLAVHYK